MNIEIRNNLNYTLVQSYLESEKKNDANNCYMGNSRWIFFYEWSNTDATPITFCSLSKFVRFLRVSNIKYTQDQLRFARDHRYLYSACKYGVAELEITNSLYQLKNIINK